MSEIWDVPDQVGLGPEDINPTGDRILVRRLSAAEKRGKIYIPQTSQQPQYIAKIYGCGPDAEEIGYSPGQYILLGRWNAIKLALFDNPDAALESDRYHEYSLISCEDVLGTIEEEVLREKLGKELEGAA